MSCPYHSELDWSCLMCLRAELANALDEKRALQNRLDAMAYALVWCGAASDFQKGGRARVGWENVVLPLINAHCYGGHDRLDAAPQKPENCTCPFEDGQHKFSCDAAETYLQVSAVLAPHAAPAETLCLPCRHNLHEIGASCKCLAADLRGEDAEAIRAQGGMGVQG